MSPTRSGVSSPASRETPACSSVSPPTSIKDEKTDRVDHGDIVIKIDQHGGSLSRSIAHAESVLEASRERALAALVDEANQHGAEPVCRRPTMGFPPACIPTCLYLLLTTDSFEEAVSEVVNLGGDTDTAGAILGAMAGRITVSMRSRSAGWTVCRIARASKRARSPWPSGRPTGCTSPI